MSGVQAMPTAVGVAGLRGSGLVSSSSTSLFAGDCKRKARRPACSAWALRQSRIGSRSRSKRGLGIVCNLAGQYEDSFDDVQRVRQNQIRFMSAALIACAGFGLNLGGEIQSACFFSLISFFFFFCPRFPELVPCCLWSQQLMNYFTYKAVRTVLTQLYELNPPSYRWFYK
jgi:hypothetical protein